MNKAIERIKGFCCEVNEQQWNELVRVADEVGVKVDKTSRRDGIDGGKYPIAGVSICDNDIFTRAYVKSWEKIPFPSFLAKLKGDEEWQPKAGEMVECRDGIGADWFMAKYVGHDGKWAVCRPEHHPLGHYTVHDAANFRQLLPTITRAEAEKQLGKRIID